MPNGKEVRHKTIAPRCFNPRYKQQPPEQQETFCPILILHSLSLLTWQKRLLQLPLLPPLPLLHFQ